MGPRYLFLSLVLLYCIGYTLAGQAKKTLPHSSVAEMTQKDSGEVLISHKIHAGTLKIDCAFCHQKTASDVAIPVTNVCNTCHILPLDSITSTNTMEALWRISKRIRQGDEVAEYETSKLFNHDPHSTMKCIGCHREEHPENAGQVDLSKCERCHYGTGETSPYWRRPIRVDSMCKVILKRR